jgi:dTDP-glucose pyrophosphorylase
MTERQYTGVILAAGRGSRMAPFSENHPKPVLPICNKPLIRYQIDTMKSLGIRKLIVLVGHKGYEVAKVLGDGSALGVEIRYVEQASTLGIAHAVGKLEPHIDSPFLLFLGDIFFLPSNMQLMFRLFEEQGGGVVLATKEEPDPAAIRKNFSITLSPEGYATRVVEKPRHTTNRLKGCGIYLFDPAIFDAIRRTPRTAMRDEYEITDSIQVAIYDGLPVRPANVILEDINLTNPADLLLCNLIQARQMSPQELIGTETQIHSAARIEHSVLGSKVVIQNPIRVVNSVIFDGTRVTSETDFENHILTPECTVDCTYLLQSVPANLWTSNIPAPV